MSSSDQPAMPSDSALTTAAPGEKRSNGLAIASLVLGIAAILLFWTVFGGLVLGLLALIFGIVGARRARAGRAQHGKISIAGAILGALGMLASAVILAIGASVLGSDEFRNFDDCVDQATTQREREACAEDFGKDTND